MNIAELISRGDSLFSKRSGLLSLWQEQADHFYVERSDFTVTRNLGTDFAAHLTTSYPLLVRRDLGDQISSILRPPGEQWFDVSIEREERLGNEEKRWLERATKTQYRAMYDLHSGFVRSTKECDHDWATFGNGVISAEINWDDLTLLHRCWHLRDVAWVEDYAGRICEIHRKCTMSPYDMTRKFKGKVHQKIKDRAIKEPFCDILCRHVVMEAGQYYDGKRVKDKYVSLVIDVENETILEETQRRHLGYVVPRWKTIAGSQYAFSPATVIALPDARLIQSMALSLLEAGEMSVRPPLITVPDVLREDVQYFAGGITKADIESDRQLKDVLAPILQDRSGFNFGMDLVKDTRDMIASAFYINKLMLPPAEKVMTAYETSQRVREYIRQSSPLFEPLLSNYNGELCEMDFELLMSVGTFGPKEEFPQKLRGQNVRFKFKNPLQEAADQKKGQTLQMAIELTAQTMQLDRNASSILNAPVALRDALGGIGAEADWLYDEAVSDRMVAQQQQQAKLQQQVAMAQAAGQAGQDIGKAGKELEAVA